MFDDLRLGFQARRFFDGSLTVLKDFQRLFTAFWWLLVL